MRLKDCCFDNPALFSRIAMFLAHVIVVLGFTTAVGAVLASIRPMTRRNPYWI